MLPVSGRDIQDEKILGTFHVATGRSDHLGGRSRRTASRDKSNATHDDILFSPTKTPEIDGTRRCACTATARRWRSSRTTSRRRTCAIC